jgi:sugar lactone lactonase YvrE
MGNAEVFPQPDLLIGAEASVGEGPVIDPRTGRLCWVDILEGLLYENDLAAGSQHVASLGTIVGAAVPREREEGFAVAVADGLGFWSAGRLTVADLALPEPHRRMNDAKCDSRGRLWAGSTHMEFAAGAGALHRWDGCSPSITVANGLTLPNGLGWNPQDTTMYLIDSMTSTVLAAPYDADDGQLGEFAPLCHVDPGLPDGLAVDVDGSIWIAIWGGSAIHRYNASGELTGTVPMPVTQPSSCAFGDDGTLYITTARHGLTAEELHDQPHAGSVFALATTTCGVPIQTFRA